MQPDPQRRHPIDTLATQTLARFTEGAHEQPLFLPDLTLWYEWHARTGTLPAPTLSQIARQLNVPHWQVTRPWRAETHTTEISTKEGDGERVKTYRTSVGELSSRWTVGPDGDYWQTEYPAKTAEDLRAVLEIAKDRTYGLVSESDSRDSDAQGEGEAQATSSVSAVDLPLRPPAMLVYEFLGLSEGLMLMWDEPELVEEIMDVLEDRIQALMPEIAGLPEVLVVSPDNLDAQFFSPDMFRNRLVPSYARTADILHSTQKGLIVHAGGPAGSLLGEFKEAGIDGVQGIAGPPQGDTDLRLAREKAGPEITLWGGIPQDYLLETHDTASFETAVQAAADAARNQSRMILGVADRVPPQANFERLKSIPDLIAR